MTRSSSPTRTECRRGGFTLVELMIVVAIIGILLALSAAVTIQFIDVQQKNSTELTVQKTYSALEKRWKTVIDQAKTETLPSSILAMAGGHEGRARVIWIKLRLKQEFPMSFQEARFPYLPVNPYVNAQILPPRQTYVNALSGVPAAGNNESINCLVLSLQQGTSGGALKVEEFGSSFKDINNDKLSEIIDSWDTPLVFVRWPILNPEVANSKNFDPLDPEGTLLDPTWNNYANCFTPATNTPVHWFEELCHPIHVGTTPQTYIPTSLFTAPPVAGKASFSVPVVASAGKDKQFSFTAPFMAPAAANTGDDILSYRMTFGARGGN